MWYTVTAHFMDGVKCIHTYIRWVPNWFTWRVLRSRWHCLAQAVSERLRSLAQTRRDVTLVLQHEFFSHPGHGFNYEVAPSVLLENSSRVRYRALLVGSLRMQILSMLWYTCTVVVSLLYCFFITSGWVTPTLPSTPQCTPVTVRHACPMYPTSALVVLYSTLNCAETSNNRYIYELAVSRWLQR